MKMCSKKSIWIYTCKYQQDKNIFDKNDRKNLFQNYLQLCFLLLFFMKTQKKMLYFLIYDKSQTQHLEFDLETIKKVEFYKFGKRSLSFFAQYFYYYFLYGYNFRWTLFLGWNISRLNVNRKKDVLILYLSRMSVFISKWLQWLWQRNILSWNNLFNEADLWVDVVFWGGLKRVMSGRTLGSFTQCVTPKISASPPTTSVTKLVLKIKNLNMERIKC